MMKLRTLTDEIKKELLENILGTLQTPSLSDLNKMRELDNIAAAHRYDIYQSADGRWITYIQDETKKDGRRKIARKNKEDLVEFLRKHYEGEDKDGAMTLLDVYPSWLRYKAADKASSSLRRWDNDWHRFYLDEPLSKELINTPMDKLTAVRIRTWACDVIKKQGLTRKAWRGMMSIIIDCYDFLIQDGKLTNNPARRLKISNSIFAPLQSNKTEAFNDDEMEAVIEKAWEHYNGSQDERWLAIPLLYYTGMRLGEVEALTFDDFDDAAHTLTISKSLKAVQTIRKDGTFAPVKYQIADSLKQGAMARHILIGDSTIEIKEEIKNNHKRRGSKQKRLFDVPSHANIEKKLRQICKELGIEQRSPHKLRKTNLSKLIRETNDLAFAQHQAGHKDATTTLRSYVRQTETDKVKLAALNSL